MEKSFGNYTSSAGLAVSLRAGTYFPLNYKRCIRTVLLPQAPPFPIAYASVLHILAVFACH